MQLSDATERSGESAQEQEHLPVVWRSQAHVAYIGSVGDSFLENGGSRSMAMKRFLQATVVD